MKKAISIFLAVIFLISTIGVSVAVGYCPMKKNYTVSLATDKKNCCCKKPGKKNCCKSVKLVIKKIEDRYVSSSFHLAAPTFEAITLNHSQLTFSICKLPVETTFYKEFDPPERSVPLNILYHSILI